MTEIEEQTQCPNCGGYKVSGSQILEDLPEKTYEQVHILWFIVFWIFFIATCAVLIGFLTLFQEQTRKLLFSRQQLVGPQHVGNKYSCNLCGYKWQWMLGTPKPEIQFKPELMALGAKKLAEEAAEAAKAEARRRQD